MTTNQEKRIAPEGITTVCPYLMVESVETQMEFLIKVLDASVTDDTNRIADVIQHGEVKIGDTTIMMGRASSNFPARQSMNFVYVDQVDEVFEKAIQNGAIAIMAPDDRDYGYREAGFTDLFGNQWWVAEIIT